MSHLLKPGFCHGNLFLYSEVYKFSSFSIVASITEFIERSCDSNRPICLEKNTILYFIEFFMNVYGMVTVITFMPTTNLLPERSASLHTPCFPFWQLYVLEYLQGNPDEKI